MSNDATQTASQCHIRWMIRRDMPEVMAIKSLPWTEDEFNRILRLRNHIGIVAEHEEKIAGFMIYGLYKTRIDIANFAVAADMRRCGIGTQMAVKQVSKLSAQRRSSIGIVVPEPNLPAQLFFRSIGWMATEITDDGYLFEFFCEE